MSLLALEKLFVADARDGTLDLMLLSPISLPLIVFSKLVALIVTMLIVLGLMLIPAALYAWIEVSRGAGSAVKLCGRRAGAGFARRYRRES